MAAYCNAVVAAVSVLIERIVVVWNLRLSTHGSGADETQLDDQRPL